MIKVTVHAPEPWMEPGRGETLGDVYEQIRQTIFDAYKIVPDVFRPIEP